MARNPGLVKGARALQRGNRPRRREVTIYDNVTGEILGTAECRPGDEAATLGEHVGWVEGRVDGRESRIDPETGLEAALSEFAPSVVVGPYGLSGLPDATRAYYGPHELETTGGVCSFQLQHPQRLRVKLRAPGYRDAMIEFDCEPGADTGNVITQDARRLRAKAYPSAGDQLDAIWKGLEAYSRGEPLPAETVEQMDHWRAVKDRFPKPGRTDT